MNVLWVATKAPWPPADGGRLLLLDTLRALAAAGHRLTLVAPVTTGRPTDDVADALAPWCRPSLVPVRGRPLALDALRAQLARSPLTLVRHARAEVRRRARDLVRDGAFDLVMAEQVQALDAAEAAELPVVLRAQNVESDLWAQTARQSAWRRSLLLLEARRLADREGLAVRRADATVALTAEDAGRLATLAGTTERVHHVPAPFEPELPAAESPLPGSPPVVLFGSRGWRPNAAGAGWFLRRAWPRMRAARPDAVLHVFGLDAAGDGIVSHPSPADSRAAFPAGGVLVVPLEIASGVRIKVLEAWARGVAVIATPEAARGLAAEDGEHLLLARDGRDFAGALARLAEGDLAARLVEQGRSHLRRHHDPARVARRLTEICEEVAR